MGSVPSKSYNLMSYGIPAVYIAAENSELKKYADKYRHAACFVAAELDRAATFILRLSEDKKLYQQFVDNNLLAAKDFRRNNADKIVSAYLNHEDTKLKAVEAVIAQ